MCLPHAYFCAFLCILAPLFLPSEQHQQGFVSFTECGFNYSGTTIYTYLCALRVHTFKLIHFDIAVFLIRRELKQYNIPLLVIYPGTFYCIVSHLHCGV